MKIKFDYNNMMESAIGEQGITDKKIADDKAKMLNALDKVISNRGKGWQEWTELPYADSKEIKSLVSFCDDIRKKAESFVVLGIGGSALGPLSVMCSLLHLHHNELPREKRNAPKYYVEDNVDPERMTALLDTIDLDTAYFNVITKSGETSETLAQFMVLYTALKSKLGEKVAKERIIVTTTIGKGTLYEIASKEGFKIFGVGQGVGGRFSVLCPVGLVPFAVCGIDVVKLLNGAKAMAEVSQNKDITKNPALLTAYFQVASIEQGKNISVMMPYADSLRYMADFYCQIWGESLGKAVDNDGKQVFAGQTPAKALGVTDQHSQIQLYTEGPFDKVVTFIGVDKYRTTETIPADMKIDSVDFLAGQTMNDLIKFERRATRYALTKAKRSNFTITLPEVTEETVGELLMYYMYQTAFAGALLNIDTYNQPGVEEGKKATFAMLGRKGYEQKLAELNSIKKNSKYTI